MSERESTLAARQLHETLSRRLKAQMAAWLATAASVHSVSRSLALGRTMYGVTAPSSDVMRARKTGRFSRLRASWSSVPKTMLSWVLIPPVRWTWSVRGWWMRAVVSSCDALMLTKNPPLMSGRKKWSKCGIISA